MNYFTRRRLHKLTTHLRHEAHHARHMRADIASATVLQQLATAEAAVQAAWAERAEAPRIELALDALSLATRQVLPPRNYPRLRENIEILAVALAVAMGCRTYFVQPFKIPTGSMQPTLYGITVTPQTEPQWYDRFPFSVVPMALWGERYQEVVAKVEGMVEGRVGQDEDGLLYYVAGTAHRVPKNMAVYVNPGDVVAKGQLIASGRVKLGDHIFVNKVLYNLRRPARGDIIVFSTDQIQYARIQHDTFYIKRLVGLPGETIGIDPPYLLANGKRVEQPYPFWRLLHEEARGYRGYILARSDPGAPAYLDRPGATLSLGAGDYLPMGDNTYSSLDGRYFGPVRQESLVGPAFAVYWPFGRNWGWVR